MPTSSIIKNRLKNLKQDYDQLKLGKETLLSMIDETELSKSVYNSNDIENSTLTLPETEKILLEMEVSRNINLREVYEAQNLARIIKYMSSKANESELTAEIILLLHK